MGRVKVNLTLDASVAETARALGLNMSRLAEAAISDAAKAERNRRWRIENQQALDTYAQEVEAEGLPLEATDQPLDMIVTERGIISV